MSKSRVSGLLLAAGKSSRFGRLKQVEEFQGEPLVARAVKTLRRSKVDEVIVVLGFQASRVLRSLSDRRVRVVLNPSFESGISTSLRMGISALDARSRAVLVVLADQPLVDHELLDTIIETFSKTRARAVASSSGDLVSPPVLLDRDLFSKIDRLTGDCGAKSVALSEPSLVLVRVNPEVLLDIDTEESLANAKDVIERATQRRALRSAKALGASRP